MKMLDSPKTRFYGAIRQKPVYWTLRSIRRDIDKRIISKINREISKVNWKIRGLFGSEIIQRLKTLHLTSD